MTEATWQQQPQCESTHICHGASGCEGDQLDSGAIGGPGRAASSPVQLSKHPLITAGPDAMPSSLMKPQISKQTELCLALDYLGRNTCLADSYWRSPGA